MIRGMMQKDWEHQVEELIPRLRRYARVLTRHRDSADDLVQDCLERAWAKRHTWQPGSDLRAWLFTIMHNIFVNSIRVKQLPTEQLEEEAHAARHESLENGHLLRDFERCLDQLKPDTREILVLACLEQMPYKEIAEVTDIPIGTVMSRLSRGREQLRLLMEGHDLNNVVRIK